MKRALFLLFLVAHSLLGLTQTYTLKDKWVDCGNGCQLLDPYYSDGVSFTWKGPSKGGKANGHGTAIKYVTQVSEVKIQYSMPSGQVGLVMPSGDCQQ